MHKRYSILSGIYQYSFKNGGRKYIGSSRNLRTRGYHHLSLLKLNKHTNRDLQSDYNNYGLSNVIYEVLEFVPNQHWINGDISDEEFGDYLFEIEQKYFDLYFAKEAICSRDTRFYRLLYNKSPQAKGSYSKENIESTRIVYKYNLNGEFLDYYLSSAEASVLNNIDSSSIRRCCDGTRKSAGGFYWSYNKIDNIVIPTRNDEKPILQYSKEQVFIKEWSSISKAEEFLGIRITPKGKHSKTNGGFIWKYK